MPAPCGSAQWPPQVSRAVATRAGARDRGCHQRSLPQCQQTVNGLILYKKSQDRLVILDVNEGVTHCLEKVVPGNLPFFGCLHH